MRALHGLTRSLIANMVSEYRQGIRGVLEISGTGYGAQVQGNKLVLALGLFSSGRIELPGRGLRLRWIKSRCRLP